MASETPKMTDSGGNVEIVLYRVFHSCSILDERKILSS